MQILEEVNSELKDYNLLNLSDFTPFGHKTNTSKIRNHHQLEFVETTLKKYKKITDKDLFEYLPSKDPKRYLYDLIPLYMKRKGKGIRPALCIATCNVFGGTTEKALGSAVSLELLHNAFLVHDDIEDMSKYRRGAITMHEKYNLGVAVNVGDAMNILSIKRVIGDVDLLGSTLTWRILAELEYMVRESIEGQAIELGWIYDNSYKLTQDDYLRMVLKKTCWYTSIYPIRIGALIATDGDIDLDRFNRFGFYLGATFQIQDDILNLLGDRKKYGKEIGGDIWEGKRTLILIHLLNNCSKDEKERLLEFLLVSRVLRRKRDLIWVNKLLDKHGSIDFARSCAFQLAGAALKEFFGAFGDMPESDDKLFIHDLIIYMIKREF